MTVTELRPLSLGELLDRTFSLYREHFWLFAGIMVLPQLVVLVVAVPLRVASRTQPNISTTTIPTHAASVIFLLFLFVTAFLAMHMTALAATVSAVSEMQLGRPTGVRLAYCFLRDKWWRVLWVAILNGLIVGLGFLLFVIPGLIILVRTAVAIPAAVLENQRGWAAIKRADLLTERHRGPFSSSLSCLPSWTGRRRSYSRFHSEWPAICCTARRQDGCPNSVIWLASFATCL
ncbi:MAG: hypothetical protein DMG27_14115 [Acidobacteria bacterium]|nr:MAG: hypothetical protein DMG27_14115 [Acidobacteriota bacterium]